MCAQRMLIQIKHLLTLGVQTERSFRNRFIGTMRSLRSVREPRRPRTPGSTKKRCLLATERCLVVFVNNKPIGCKGKKQQVNCIILAVFAIEFVCGGEFPAQFVKMCACLQWWNWIFSLCTSLNINTWVINQMFDRSTDLLWRTQHVKQKQIFYHRGFPSHSRALSRHAWWWSGISSHYENGSFAGLLVCTN